MRGSQKLKNENKLELKFNSRGVRDNFLFVLKAFNTKRALKNSVIMNRLEKINFNDS